MGLYQRIASLFGRGGTADTAAQPPAIGEQRTIENSSFQVNAAQLDLLFGIGPTRAGVQLNEFTAMTVVAVFAAHQILGQTLGMLPWAVFDGDEDDRQRSRAKEHPAYNLLRREPNPEMTPIVMKEVMMHHCLGWGNAYARIWRDNADRPVAIRPLRPHLVRPERRAGSLVYYYSDAGEVLDPMEVLHIPGLSFDGLKGYSPIAMAREALAGGKAAELFGSTFFGNGAAVKGILKMPNRLKPEAMANLRESWNAMYAGPGNSHKTAILEEGMDFVQTSVAPDEAQFIATRQFSVIDVARLYRLPPRMLGDTSHAVGKSIEQEGLEFLVYTMSPWMTKFEQEATRKLCDEGKSYVKFDERALLRADLTARQAYYAGGRMWGYFSANDVLRMEGEQAIGPQGDVYLSPANEVNAKTMLDPAKPPAIPPQSAGKPGSGSEAFGGKDPTNQIPHQQQNGRAIATAAMRVVFEDAVARMLRKEHNALSRGKADDDFYASHRSHFIEALAPAVCSLGQMLGEPLDTGRLKAFAEERHADLNRNLPVLAAQKAGEIIQTLTAEKQS